MGIACRWCNAIPSPSRSTSFQLVQNGRACGSQVLSPQRQPPHRALASRDVPVDPARFDQPVGSAEATRHKPHRCRCRSGEERRNGRTADPVACRDTGSGKDRRGWRPPCWAGEPRLSEVKRCRRHVPKDESEPGTWAKTVRCACVIREIVAPQCITHLSASPFRSLWRWPRPRYPSISAACGERWGVCLGLFDLTSNTMSI